MDQDLFSSTTPFTPPTTEAGKLSWLRLIRSHRVGPTTFHRLIATHGSAEAALAELPRIAAQAGVAGYQTFPLHLAQAEVEAARRAGMTALFWGASDYPSQLARLPDAPPLLWRRGPGEICLAPMVAIVGARNASSLGMRMAARLARGLGEMGFITVSGMARGIDTAAHKGALETGTVAVFAGGADYIYPPENAALAERLAEQGAILSEMPPGKVPQARHFPNRNRLISGLSLGVVIVEAAERSGSMLTARTALDQGREVMAVPGHPVDPRAAGCNLMLREGCTLVRHVEDVLEALTTSLAAARRDGAQLAPPTVQHSARSPAPPPVHGRAANHLPRPEQIQPRPGTSQAARALVALSRPLAAPLAGLRHIILEKLSSAPLAEDQLSRDLALGSAELAPELLLLELEGEIQRQPGGFLIRTV